VNFQSISWVTLLLSSTKLRRGWAGLVGGFGNSSKILFVSTSEAYRAADSGLWESMSRNSAISGRLPPSVAASVGSGCRKLIKIATAYVPLSFAAEPSVPISASPFQMAAAICSSGTRVLKLRSIACRHVDGVGEGGGGVEVALHRVSGIKNPAWKVPEMGIVSIGNDVVGAGRV